MGHIALHFLVPLLIAWLGFRSRWKVAYMVMIATMVVDLDHLLADPIYDPQRCSIGFHPLHTEPLVMLYAGMFALPWLWGWRRKQALTGRAWWVQLVGLGLLLHMALDGLDCLG